MNFIIIVIITLYECVILFLPKLKRNINQILLPSMWYYYKHIYYLHLVMGPIGFCISWIVFFLSVLQGQQWLAVVAVLCAWLWLQSSGCQQQLFFFPSTSHHSPLVSSQGGCLRHSVLVMPLEPPTSSLVSSIIQCFSLR